MANNVVKICDINEMGEDQRQLFQLFDEFNISQVTYKHPAIFTVEEGIALQLPELIPGQHGKSLFLKTQNGELWLVVACEETRVDLKGLSIALGTKRFSFAKPELMVEVLGVTPGSATPFALKNDHARQVKVVLDQKFLDHDDCVFHPLINIYSTVISVADLRRFFNCLGYTPHIMPLF